MLAEFDEAAAKVKNLQSLPSNEELLDLYGYFKQVRSAVRLVFRFKMAKRAIMVCGVCRCVRPPRRVLHSIVCNLHNNKRSVGLGML